MRAHLFLFLALLTALLTGCGRVHELYYLQGDFADDTAYDGPLDRVNMVNDVAGIKGRTLMVQLADPNKTIARKHSRINRQLNADYWTNKFQPQFEGRVADAMWQSRVFSDVCAASDPAPIARPDLVLKVAVTQWHEGYGLLRAYFGFGIGAAREQWEGALLDARTNKVLFAFADAQLHPGGPAPLGLSFKIWRGYQLITEKLLESVHEVGDALRQSTNTTDPWLPENNLRPMTRPTPSPVAAAPAAPAQPVAAQDKPAAPAKPATAKPAAAQKKAAPVKPAANRPKPSAATKKPAGSANAARPAPAAIPAVPALPDSMR